ncbi:hypothetical protein [Herbaspirillum aquaticum]|uniref:DNA-binding protein n=1 Tax=Herbaspirillum aquaticum TaxID=568783 RepID=A0A225SMJ1_9BURK|nr:hypothetical protein [Herbaspirillum aquaticum]OWY31878.1 hypothetical protein CEJ45_23925 [Herbaspirillum aquaticum]
MQQISTLDLVLRSSGGALLVPLKKTADILGLEPQTIRNRLCTKTFELVPVRIGRMNYFRIADIASLIDATIAKSCDKPKRGRPPKSASKSLLRAAEMKKSPSGPIDGRHPTAGARQ